MEVSKEQYLFGLKLLHCQVLLLTGEMMAMVVIGILFKNGSLHLDIGGSRIWGNSILNNNSWRHVALVMPRGAKSAQDVLFMSMVKEKM